MHRGSINGIPGGNQIGANLSIGNSRSPAKESYLNRSASLDEAGNVREDGEDADDGERMGKAEMSVSPPAKTDGIPIRR